MKAQLKVKSDLIVEVEGDTQAELFKGVASAKEVFSHAQCGYCKGTDINFVVREDREENEYFELHCLNRSCRARLPFGQNKTPKGSLYPKRRWDSLSPSEKTKRADEEKHAVAHYGYLDHDGWYKYVPGKEENK